MNSKYTLEDYLNLLKDHGQVLEYHADDICINKIVNNITYDSKEVTIDTLFVCKGKTFKPEYLYDAFERGSFCYISEKKYSKNSNYDMPCIIVNDIRKAMGYLANIFYNEAWKEFNLIGITGTKGKSTTAYFMKSVLDTYTSKMEKIESGIISSINTFDGVINKESRLTTPESLVLHKHFRNAANSGISEVVMEVSSQALKYNRVQGIQFDLGCFLNIGDDHISENEHSDFDDYFDSKLSMFNQTNTAFINLDMDHVEEVIEVSKSCKELITFGYKDTADFCAKDAKKIGDNIIFTVSHSEFEKKFELSIPGFFNVENALATIAMCYYMGIGLDDIHEGLLNAKVSGRMEVFKNKEKNLTVIVDYAHNRLSFDKLFNSVISEFSDSEIISIFGCPGGKAVARRQELGEIAGRFAKKVYITEEDYGEEDFYKISKEIADNVSAQGGAYEIILDREEAIKKAIESTKKATVILVTGKGRETRQKRGTRYIPCTSDVDVVLKYL